MPSSTPSIDELRAVCQPIDVVGRPSAEHWAGRLYMRRISIYPTRWFIRHGFRPNTITGIMMIVGLAGASLFAFNSLIAAVIGAILIQTYLLLDCSDGEVARWTSQTSNKGVFLDRLSHYVVEATLLAALGIRGSDAFAEPAWVALGLLAAVLHILAKAETDLASGINTDQHALPASSEPHNAGLGRLRRLSRILPIQRMAGAIEASLLAVVASTIDLARSDLMATRIFLIVLVAATAITAVLHAVMILNSDRLDPPADA